MNRIDTSSRDAVEIPIEPQLSMPVLEVKTQSVFKRVVNSHLAQCVAIAACMAIGAAVAYGTAVCLATTAIATAALGISVFNSKHLMYETSIIPTALKKSTQTLGDDILPGLLTLGPIPLKNKGDHHKLIQQGITLVVTLLERFEWETASLFSDPMTLEDWGKVNIRQKVLETEDFNGVPLDIIEKGVVVLHDEIDNKKGHVYCHCKAGRGRSVTIVIAYLLRYGHRHGIKVATVAEAIAFVKSKRSVININEDQQAALDKYFNTLNKPVMK